MLGCEDHIGRKSEFETATAANAVDRGNDRLVEARQFLQAAKAADAIIAIDRIAIICGFKVPAWAKELFAAGRQDRNPQLRIIAKRGKGVAHDAAGRQIDGIGFGAVEGDLQDATFTAGFDRAVGHMSASGLRSICRSASATKTASLVQINGFISSSVICSAYCVTNSWSAWMVLISARRLMPLLPR